MTKAAEYISEYVENIKEQLDEIEYQLSGVNEPKLKKENELLEKKIKVYQETIELHKQAYDDLKTAKAYLAQEYGALLNRKDTEHVERIYAANGMLMHFLDQLCDADDWSSMFVKRKAKELKEKLNGRKMD